MQQLNRKLAVLTALSLAACGGAIDNGSDSEGADVAPHVHAIASQQGKPGGGGTNGISYHGGPVVLGTPAVYNIFYSNGGFTSSDVTFLNALPGGLSGSPYEMINSTYYNGSSQHVSAAMSFGGQASTTEYLGNSLSDAQILQIISDTIGAGKLPLDPNGLYFVLTSADVTASSGFCTNYCGWHTHGNVGTTKIRYSFVGDPDRCPAACNAQTSSPNAYGTGVNGMASIYAHESEETFSDPDGNAWYDTRGAENADKCAWTFGTEFTSNGARANITLGGTNMLIQQNWVNASGGYCSMHYP